MDTTILVPFIVMYIVIGFLSAFASSLVYTNYNPDRRHLAVGFFWPLFWIFGIVRLFIIAIFLVWHMLFAPL